MRIAILGWGSLVWDPRDLPLASAWLVGGPQLPIEFSRVSDNGRLTLVIDPINGVPIASRFATSRRDELDQAVEDLRRREGPTRRENIGSACAQDAGDANDIAAHLAVWCRGASFDAVVWTALAPNFAEKRRQPFGVDAALAYLAQLTGERRRADDIIVDADR